MSLIARAIEAAGLPTLILGSALDILASGAAPRVQFLNYPLGFSSGSFRNPGNQYDVVKSALSGFDHMKEPGIEHLDYSWDEGWEMVRAREKQGKDEDSRSHRDTTPRYQTEEDRILAESRL